MLDKGSSLRYCFIVLKKLLIEPSCSVVLFVSNKEPWRTETSSNSLILSQYAKYSCHLRSYICSHTYCFPCYPTPFKVSQEFQNLVLPLLMSPSYSRPPSSGCSYFVYIFLPKLSDAENMFTYMFLCPVHLHYPTLPSLPYERPSGTLFCCPAAVFVSGEV